MDKMTEEQRAYLDKWRLPYLASTTKEQADLIIQSAKARAGLLGYKAKKEELIRYRKDFDFKTTYDKNRGNRGIQK